MPCSPSPRPRHRRASSDAGAEPLGGDAWRVELGIANTGWLPTDVTARARAVDLAADRRRAHGAAVVGGPGASGSVSSKDGRRCASESHDGTPDRALVTWVVEAAPGTQVTVTARHDRAGQISGALVLDAPAPA